MILLAGDSEHKFSISYGELREHYHNFCDMDDEKFIENIIDALHLACIICYFKETPTEYSLGEEGIVHELIHVVKNDNVRTLSEIRKDFENILKLA